MTIQNPILPGFHSDPSILRAGEDYYIVTSSFTWYPGIPLHHSRDLKHWRLVKNLLTTSAQLDLSRLHPACGVWSPELSYCADEKRYYVVFTCVLSENKWMFDADNYVMWSDDLLGEWSGPHYLNSSGFDTSLLHDDDGRKWFLNKDRDFRSDKVDSRSIIIQEYDAGANKLIGQPQSISQGATARRFVEGPHLFRHGGWYYLLTAEGGTGYGHCCALSRAKDILGPYAPDPAGPFLTSWGEAFEGTEAASFMLPDKYNPAAPLQKAGHGSLVQTHTGEWYMAHLCARPVMPEQRCTLGRETAIQKLEWTDEGWLRLAGGGNIVKAEAPGIVGVVEQPFLPEPEMTTFDQPALPLCFYTPHNEFATDWFQLDGQNLRLRGRESLNGAGAVSLVARVLTAFRAIVTTRLAFEPDNYTQMAGIACYYDRKTHYCAYKSYDERTGSQIVTAHGFVNDKMVDFGARFGVAPGRDIFLKMEYDTHALRFYFRYDDMDWQPIGGMQDATPLSDEASCYGNFTGTFVGLFTQDNHTKNRWASFRYFGYQPQIATTGQV